MQFYTNMRNSEIEKLDQRAEMPLVALVAELRHSFTKLTEGVRQIRHEFI